MSPARAESDTSCANDQAVWPWQAEPYRLWSLFEMMRFYAASFMAMWQNLQIANGHIAFTAVRDDGNRDWDDVTQRLRKALTELGKACKEMPLSQTMQAQIDRAVRQVTTGADVENAATMTRIIEIEKNIINEMSTHFFLAIPAQQRYLYDQGKDPVFGKAVADKFPDASDDIAAAARCLALDEWTASVFHSMRALEHGLRWLAASVGLSPEAMAHENWKNVIDQIEKRIREMESATKSLDKTERMRVSSEAASQFRYFKDAWRNHVSHSRATYDPRSGSSVFNHVRDFMQHLAANA